MGQATGRLGVRGAGASAVMPLPLRLPLPPTAAAASPEGLNAWGLPGCLAARLLAARARGMQKL